MEETMSLSDIFHTLNKRWKLIVLLILAAVLIGAGISYFLLKPKYQASTQILVNQKSDKNQFNVDQLRANIDMVNTYSVIIKSPTILEKTIENFNLQKSIEQLQQKITVKTQDNTQVFSLNVEDSDAARAVTIANAVSFTFQKEVPAIMNVDNVTILAKAVNSDQVNLSPILIIAAALIVGLMAGIGLVFLLEYMDRTIKDDRDAEICLGLPVLGTINKVSARMKKEERKKIGSETFVSYSETKI